MADTDGANGFVTSDAGAFHAKLRPGDVLVYDSLSFDGGLVQWGDRRPANHASLVLDDEQLIEANRSRDENPRPAVRTVPVTARLSLPTVRTITALRHRRVSDGRAPVEPVLERARSQLGQAEFAYAQIAALAPAVLLRNYKDDLENGGALTKGMTLALHVLAQALEPLYDVPDKDRLTCSEFVYRCLEDGKLPTQIVWPPAFDGAPPPWMTPEQIEEYNRLYGLDGPVATGGEAAAGDSPTLAEQVTPGDLWRSPDLVPVAVLHYPPGLPLSPSEGIGF